MDLISTTAQTGYAIRQSTSPRVKRIATRSKNEQWDLIEEGIDGDRLRPLLRTFDQRGHKDWYPVTSGMAVYAMLEPEKANAIEREKLKMVFTPNIEEQKIVQVETVKEEGQTVDEILCRVEVLQSDILIAATLLETLYPGPYFRSEVAKLEDLVRELKTLSTKRFS